MQKNRCQREYDVVCQLKLSKPCCKMIKYLKTVLLVGIWGFAVILLYNLKSNDIKQKNQNNKVFTL